MNRFVNSVIMSLTLPDICGKVSFPEKSSKERYIWWYNEYILDKYKTNFGEEEHVFLSGEDCYALRCSYIHEGKKDITNQRINEALDDFYFIEPNGNVFHRIQSDDTLGLQVDIFCHEILEGVDEWLKKVKECHSEKLKKMGSFLKIHSQENGIRF